MPKSMGRKRGNMETEGIRLNKFLGEAGICSRREADRFIEAGKVSINGQAAVPGQRVLPRPVSHHKRPHDPGGKGRSKP